MLQPDMQITSDPCLALFGVLLSLFPKISLVRNRTSGTDLFVLFRIRIPPLLNYHASAPSVRAELVPTSSNSASIGVRRQQSR